MVSWITLVGTTATLLPLATTISSPYGIQIPSTAAELDYWPTANGSSSLTWNSSWTGSSWNNWKQETVPEGLGFHYHSKDTKTWENANGEPVWVGHTFVGSRIEYWGWWSYPGTYGQGAVNLTDEKGNLLSKGSGESFSENTGKEPALLVACDFDTVGNHTTRLIPNWGTVAITHLVAYLNVSGTPEEVATAANDPVTFRFADYITHGPEPENAVTGAANDPPIQVSYTNGLWKWTPTIGATGNGPELSYPRVGTVQQNAQMKFNIGSGNIYVRLNGTMAWNHGMFQVELSPPPPGRRAQEKYWGFTPWSVVNATYYSTALNPNVNYTMTLTNVISEGGDVSAPWFEPATITMWKAPTTTKKTNVGAIVGGVVGGVLGAALIGAAIWFFLRRRRSKTRSMNNSGIHTPIDIDDDLPNHVPTPFMSHPTTMYSTASGTGTATLSGPTESGYTDRTSEYYGGSQYPGSTGAPQPYPAGSVPRATKGGAPPMAVHHPQQAADAGTLHPLLNPEEDDMIPPSYNPEWESSSTANMARSGALSAPRIPEGATQRTSTQVREEPQEVDVIKALYLRPPPRE